MGKLKHGLAKRRNVSKEFKAWMSMRRRCRLPSQRSYPLYGGRGIKVCDRWSEFENFFADMGKCPEGSSLDRIDSNGHYEPLNCRWSDERTQQRNRRNNHLLTFGGETMCIEAWAERQGLPAKTLRARIVDHGWAVDRALSVPLRLQARRAGRISAHRPP